VLLLMLLECLIQLLFFLGKKIFLNADVNGGVRIKGTKYAIVDPSADAEKVLTPHIGGKIHINGTAYVEVPRIPFAMDLKMYYGNTDYCYGTYHTVIRENTYVKDAFDVVVVDDKDEISNDILKIDFSDDETEESIEEFKKMFKESTDDNKADEKNFSKSSSEEDFDDKDSFGNERNKYDFGAKVYKLDFKERSNNVKLSPSVRGSAVRRKMKPLAPDNTTITGKMNFTVSNFKHKLKAMQFVADAIGDK